MTPLETLRHHVTGAIERGEAEAIVEMPRASRTLWAELRITAPDQTYDPMLALSDAATWIDSGLGGLLIGVDSTVFDNPLWAMQNYVNAVAFPEGWGLFDYDGTGMLQLQRMDDAEVFDQDSAALAFVVERAKTSELHGIALALHRGFEQAIIEFQGGM